MATRFMPSLLCRGKHWFVDRTFKVVRAPFVQIFSVLAFVRQGFSEADSSCLLSYVGEIDYGL